MRADLLALSRDDLASLTNRGVVKRADRELDAGEPSFRVDEDADEVRVRWSDGILCRFPTGATIQEAECSSGAPGISRHVVRSVLAYQQHAVATRASTEDLSPRTAWDPGAIRDDDLVSAFGNREVNAARERFAQGVLAELTRGPKPTARFLHEACTLRFMVEGDLRYVTSDRPEREDARWVCLAVWAFRQLPAEKDVGLVSTETVSHTVPEPELRALETLLAELASDGLSALPESSIAKMKRLDQKLRNCGLVWPAEIVSDLLQQHALYCKHDSRFEPQELPGLVGELVARIRVIRANKETCPQIFVRGSSVDLRREMKGGHLVGLGMGVRPHQGRVSLQVYLQDMDSGGVIFIGRDVPDPESDERPRDFWELGRQSVGQHSMADLGCSNVIVPTTRCSPRGELVLPRRSSGISRHPQAFEWEELTPPAAVESFKQLWERIEFLPPAWLRPRRQTENLHVIAIQGAENVRLDHPGQCLWADLLDRDRERATLRFPFYFRGREGFEALREMLRRRSEDLRFVCGHVRNVGRKLQIEPVQFVLQDDDRRRAFNPWIARQPTSEEREVFVETPPKEGPLPEFFNSLRNQLAEALLLGVGSGSPDTWGRLGEAGTELGFRRLVAPIERLQDHLQLRSEDLAWTPGSATAEILELCLYTTVL